MKRLPRVDLAHLPTPLEALPRLSEALDGPEIFVKRDDLTGLAFGGNKTRKLEYLAAAALEEGADRLLTAGAIQSNHCRQTAAAAARVGLKCSLILAGEKPATLSANNYLDYLVGAELIWVPKAERDGALEKAFRDHEKAGGKPYLVPYGGSNPLGASAYAYAIEELMSQTSERFDWIVFASSSSGTQAGMLVGAEAFGCEATICGISVDEKAAALKASVAQLANETADFLEVDCAIEAKDVVVSDDYLGAGYAVMGEAEKEAIQLFAQFEGLMLDPVYTGRAGAGLLGMIHKGEIKRGERVLFWHTGGAPALFDPHYLEKLAA